MAKGFNSRGMGGMGGGMNMNMMKQVQKMQQDMLKMQRELTALTIEPDAVDPEDVELLQDMIIAAVNEALRAAESDSASSMQGLTGGLNLPF